MIDMTLFRNPRFTAASASVAIAFFALLGFIFLMTQYFQVVRGYSPLATGVRLLPVAVSVGVASVPGRGWPCGSATRSSSVAGCYCSAPRCCMCCR